MTVAVTAPGGEIGFTETQRLTLSLSPVPFDSEEIPVGGLGRAQNLSRFLTPGDFDGDGQQDLVVQSESPARRILLRGTEETLVPFGQVS